MPIWIKICGNTSLADAQLAADAGADAVGFVFAPSPRQVSLEDVALIAPHLPPTLEKIGVFVDSSIDEIHAAVAGCGLTGVQLHFDAAEDLPARLRERLGPSVRVFRVMHFGAGPADELRSQLNRHAQDPHVDGVLIDSHTPTAVGGTGMAFDWAEARETVFAVAGSLRLISAGGLDPSNVAEAIATLRPWGVDVVSGVEAAPGRKDPDKVREFVARARAAASERRPESD
jgi:phosphoribosylanthranilate isomerase